VALARALVNRPRALLLDEPLGALDLKLRKAMQLELKRIQREVGITFVYVTHDQEEALTMSDRLVVMNAGRIEQLGTPRAMYEQPATRFVANFLGTSNIVSGRVDAEGDGFALTGLGPGERVLVPEGEQVYAGEQLDVAVRPEKTVLTPASEPPPPGHCALRGTVTDVVYLGTSTSYRVEAAGDVVEAPNLALAGIGIEPAKSTEPDWQRAAAKLAEQRDKGLVRKYFDNSGEAQALASGDVWISMAYSGDVFQLNAEKGREELRFVVPKEGAILWTDNMCIPAKAQHPLDAITYMDYVYRPEVAGALAAYINYVTPVPAAKQAIEADAAKATGEDKTYLEGIATSPFVFPEESALANTHSYRNLTPDEEKVWNRLFQPIFQS